MSDKQTTAVVILVILSLVFYLYTKGTLPSVVSAITGNTQPGTSTTSLAAYVASNAQAAVSTSTSYADPLNTGYFLNAIYGIDQSTGVISYQPPSSGDSGSGGAPTFIPIPAGS